MKYSGRAAREFGSHEETSYVLAMPLGTVKTHAMRGKAKLKLWLAPWHEANGQEQTS